jgi:glycosyltransferase involved in cell wall biosynthesis
MKNKTIIILNDYANINGGASKVAIDEAAGLANAGMNVVFFAACGPICDELKNANIKVVCLGQKELINAGKNPLAMVQGLWNFKAANELKNLLNTVDKSNTIIHLHGYTKALSASVVRVASQHKITTICTLHDFFTACPNGAFFDYVSCKPCPKTALSLDCITRNCDKRAYHHKIYRVARGLVQKYMGGLPKNIKNYITLSSQSANLLQPYLPNDAKFYPLENPIPVIKSPLINVRANSEIIFVGRLDAEKGIEILLEAAEKTQLLSLRGKAEAIQNKQENWIASPQVARNDEGSWFSLNFVGDGALRNLVEGKENCQVTGWVSMARVKQELAKARVLVFPSLWYETYGLVVAEAAAMGIPAIVSDISAAAERVQNGITGWHFRSGDAGDLGRVLELVKNDEIVEKAGLAAYNDFWKNPPILAQHIEKLIEIYNKL